VTVLFAAAAAVGFVMTRTDRTGAVRDIPITGDMVAVNETTALREPSEILQTACTVLTPLLILFGAYIFVHGHLTPGGGFQGGVVLAGALVLQILSYTGGKPGHGVLSIVESGAGIVYVLLGVAGLILGRGFLDPTFLPLGTLGQLFSAGAIPLIYTVIGLKVGTELTGVVASLGGDGAPGAGAAVRDMTVSPTGERGGLDSSGPGAPREVP
jgi:multicomponent Na+:H+ antiporter subunit B